MNWKIADLRACLNVLGVLVLLVGLGSSLYVYWAVEKQPTDVLGYEADGGDVYPILPGDSKKYLRDLEIYGGKSAVLVEEFKSWFAGLWHGKSLAWIVAGTALFVSAGLFYAASQIPSCGASDIRDKTRREKNDA